MAWWTAFSYRECGQDYRKKVWGAFFRFIYDGLVEIEEDTKRSNLLFRFRYLDKRLVSESFQIFGIPGIPLTHITVFIGVDIGIRSIPVTIEILDDDLNIFWEFR